MSTKHQKHSQRHDIWSSPVLLSSKIHKVIPCEALDTDEESLHPCWPGGPSSVPEVFLFFLSSLEHTLFPFVPLWYAGSPSIWSTGWCLLRSHLCRLTWVRNKHARVQFFLRSHQLSSRRCLDPLTFDGVMSITAFKALSGCVKVGRGDGWGWKCLKPQPSSNST